MRTKVRAPKELKVVGQVTSSRLMDSTERNPCMIYNVELTNGKTIKLCASVRYLELNRDAVSGLTMHDILSSKELCNISYLECIKGKTTWEAYESIEVHNSTFNSIVNVSPVSSNGAQIALINRAADEMLRDSQISEEKRAELKIELVANLFRSGYGL